ncbi:MAG: plastocyanin [Gloeomargarita sp. DG_1_4_bins_134]
MLAGLMRGLVVGLALVLTWLGMGQAAFAQTYQIKMGADNGMLAFQPAQLTIQVGDTVEWLNNKLPPHNVIFSAVPNGDKELAAKLSRQALVYKVGDSFRITFNGDLPTGTYTYYCTPHRGAGMQGKIVVQG